MTLVSVTLEHDGKKTDIYGANSRSAPSPVEEADAPVVTCLCVEGAEAPAESSDEGWWRAELQRLRGVFLATIGADETAERIWPKRSRWLRSRIREPPTLGSPSGSLACDRPKRVDSS